MNLFIPPLGAELTLASNWTFTLHNEHRNEPLIAGLKLTMAQDARGYYDRNATLPVTLPTGTVLIVRRYYVRAGQKAFDSVTFSTKIGKRSCRFWVKLTDANRIELAPPVVFASDEDLIKEMWCRDIGYEQVGRFAKLMRCQTHPLREKFDLICDELEKQMSADMEILSKAKQNSAVAA